MAFDALKQSSPGRANKEYLKILFLAARETEIGVDDSLRWLIDQGERITAEAVERMVASSREIPQATEIRIEDVNLQLYDTLLVNAEVSV